MPLFPTVPAASLAMYSLLMNWLPIAAGVTAAAVILALAVFGLRYWYRCRQLEESLSDARARFDKAGDALFVYTLEGETFSKFSSVSEVACRELGYEEDHLLRKSLPDLLDENAHRLLAAHVETLQANGHAVHMLPLLRSDGTSVPYEINTRRYACNGASKLISVARNREEQQRYEEGLIAAQRNAEEQDRKKTRFLNSLSHEIRTPLTGIIGFADVLAEEADQEHEEFAETISASGERLLETVGSVLDLAKLESRELELSPKRINVVDETKATVRMLQPLARRKRINLRVVSGYEELWAVQDARSITRILNNLVGNAIKFTDRGHVTVNLDANANTLFLTVEDSGKGIREEFLPRLFEAFEQEEESPSDATENTGSGLGLAITKRLVNMLGGSIDVDTEVNVGSTFKVTLPRTYVPSTKEDDEDAPIPLPMRWHNPFDQLPHQKRPTG